MFSNDLKKLEDASFPSSHTLVAKVDLTSSQLLSIEDKMEPASKPKENHENGSLTLSKNEKPQSHAHGKLCCKADMRGSVKEAALAELQQRLKVIRDRVRGVALRQHTGFYLFGRPGTSKTHTVRTTLDEMGTQYEEHSGHITDLGLFDLLSENPDRIILLDDVSSIFEHKVALQILLAACGNGNSNRGVRTIKYKRRGHEETILFTGGIIAISNLELHDNPVMEALKSRVNYLKYDPTDQQVKALMLEIASQGWVSPNGKMMPDECVEVADFLIAESHRHKVRLDIRNLVDKAFSDYLQWRNKMTETHWKDLITSTLEEQLVELKHTPKLITRDATKRDEQITARSISNEYPDRETRLKKWKELTGKSERAFYRRLQEIDS